MTSMDSTVHIAVGPTVVSILPSTDLEWEIKYYLPVILLHVLMSYLGFFFCEGSNHIDGGYIITFQLYIDHSSY